MRVDGEYKEELEHFSLVWFGFSLDFYKCGFDDYDASGAITINVTQF